MFFFRSGSIWVAWMRHLYLSRNCFWSLNEDNSTYSWTFRKILKLRPKALPFLRIKIGNGENTFFWRDPWTPFGSLFTFLGPHGPSSLGIPLDGLVKDCIHSYNWFLPPARSDRHVEVFSYISSIIISSASDLPIWSVDGRVCCSFSAKQVWNQIRETKP